MTKWRELSATIIVCSVVIITLEAAHRYFSVQQTNFTFPSMTLAEAVASHCPLQLPSTAYNIQWKTLHIPYSLAHCILIRFQAPLDDCRDFAVRTASQHSADEMFPDGMQRLPEPVMPITNSFGGAEPWFDIHHIAHGETIGSNPQMWIDSDRGILYYKATD
jgi:hypothetical protein